MHSEYRQLCSGRLSRRLDIYDRIAIGCAIGIVCLIVAIHFHWI